ncbi:phage tail tape measure protein [Comamonas thiooxydans]|uniref:phage tail tape measure protein n=1 Tax=Comamonas thiooxydans TaxID=363952 RepID=UPI00244AAF1B|nr:phage tail tape measure protein [Comamonas thiooxydans]MDH1252887.1 phage tail tape measure protein [Comamonas thiooxydans]
MAENSQDRKASFIVSAENDTKSTFQEIKADAAEMAGSVEKAGERAARGVSSIGDGAEVAAQKLTREEGRMSSALIRATEQARIAAQAGTSMAKAFELKADMRGMDMSRITPLAAELRKAEQALAEYKAQQAQAASQTSFIDSLRAQAEAVGKTRLELLELKAAQLGITTQASPYIAQLRNAENAQGRLGKTAGELQWALRGVPAQLSDIAVSIEGGMPLMTVFMQQGFQLRDMFGSWGAAGRGVVMSLIGMVTPLTAVSAGVLALTAAYYYGSKERDAFLRSLVMTGDAAGVSTDGLVIMSRQISDSVGTQAKATEALVAFVDAGVKGQSELRKYTQTAIEWERATGEGVDKTAAKFASLQEDPLAAVQKLNEGTNFLTAAVYEQIKSLQDQGDETAAAEVAMDALDTAMRDRSKRIVESLGWIEKAWRGIKDAAAGAAETMANAGRPPTKEDELQRVRTLISNKEIGLKGNEDTSWGRMVRQEIEGHRQQEWALLSAINDEVLGGVQSNADRLALAARVASDKAHEKYKPKSEKKDDEQAARKRVYDDLIDKNGYRYTPEQLAKEKATFEADMAAISKKYEEKGPKGSSKPARDDLSIDVNAFKRQLDDMTSIYAGSQKILESQRSAGLIDDREYFEARRGFINLEADAQDMLLNKELERYKQEKVTKDNRLQVEKGITDTQAKLNKSRLDRAVSLELLGKQETAALNAQKAALDAAERSAAAYLLTLQRGFDRNVDAVGWGTERRNVEGGRQQIEDRYSQQRMDLDNQRAKAEFDADGQLSPQQTKYYEDRQALIDKYEALALDAYGSGVRRRLEAEGNWLNGVSRAFQDYSSSAANVAQQSADMFGNAFKGMEDALTSFVMTGKADFKSLANSIIADIVRTQVRAQASGLFGSLVNGITGLFGGSPGSAGASATSILNTGIGFGSLAGGRATGGGVLPRSIYEVNERDVPELASFGGRQYLMTADQPGSVTPLAQAAATMPGRAVVSGGSMPSVRVELINKGGQAAEVTSASLGMDADGGLLVRAVIEQAKKAAVQEVASQTAGDYGDMGQAMRQRERMGMR